MNKKMLISLLPLCLLVLPGCWGRKINIRATAYADSTALPYGFEKQRSFCIDGASSIDGVKQPVDELEIKELSKKISHMLVNNGYRVAQHGAADYCLRFNFGCKRGTQTYNSLKYVPGKTYKTNTTVIGTSGLNNYDQTTTAPGQFVFVPEYYSVFSKFLDFYVYDKKGYEQITKNDKAPSSHVWYGHTESTDECPNMRTDVDYLLMAMFESFGENDSFETSIPEKDKSVKLLREQMFGRRGRH